MRHISCSSQILNIKMIGAVFKYKRAILQFSVRQIPPPVAPKIARLNINDITSVIKFTCIENYYGITTSDLTAGAQIRRAMSAMGQKQWAEYFSGLEKNAFRKIFDRKFFDPKKNSTHNNFRRKKSRLEKIEISKKKSKTSKKQKSWKFREKNENFEKSKIPRKKKRKFGKIENFEKKTGKCKKIENFTHKKRCLRGNPPIFGKND